jgi:hypothetical protein
MGTNEVTAQMTLDSVEVDMHEFDTSADEITDAGRSVERLQPLSHLRARQPKEWISEAMLQLQAVERLPHGWDSHSGSPPDRETVWSGAALLASLVRADPNLTKPRIHPTPSGGVQFHWEMGEKYFEIEMLDPRNARFYFVDHEGTTETEGTLRMGDLLDDVVKYVRRVVRES